VLDPEQNSTFSDHYLEIPYDLSKVMFIGTANIRDTIPPPLLDRMEAIDLPGYTRDEKKKIAQQFLIPRQLEEHGLKEYEFQWKEEALDTIIDSYTREAGVRNLEREIAALCRHIAVRVAEDREVPEAINKKVVQEVLGPPKFYSEVAGRTPEVGVATGLAWTPSGGDIIFVEATKMAGQGKMHLTGQLGSVMKESVQAAFSYVHSKENELGISSEIFDKSDLHVHVPAGAIPKDGPSAGITMYVAISSRLTGIQIRPDVAMTGEITLRGMVLQVGGIKEKVLAAHRAGIKEIIIPKRNEKDLVEIPDEIRADLKFHFIQNVEEALDIAFVTPPVAKKIEVPPPSRPSEPPIDQPSA
jgi:ATP-dependent Lon protease